MLSPLKGPVSFVHAGYDDEEEEEEEEEMSHVKRPISNDTDLVTTWVWAAMAGKPPRDASWRKPGRSAAMPR